MQLITQQSESIASLLSLGAWIEILRVVAFNCIVIVAPFIVTLKTSLFANKINVVLKNFSSACRFLVGSLRIE